MCLALHLFQASGKNAKHFIFLHVIILFKASRTTQRTLFAPAKLTVSGVFSRLREIASMTGHSVSNICWPYKQKHFDVSFAVEGV